MKQPDAKSFNAIERLEPGDELEGGFEIRRMLGRGGAAIVFEAWEKQLRRRVAIKVPTSKSTTDLLVREGQTLAAFRHPGLTTVHAIGNHSGVPFIVMERLRGHTLRQILETDPGSGIPWREAVHYLSHLADVLAVLHRADLAHRDLKPENIMICPAGRVVLIDLGIVQEERRIEEERTIAGTPEYMAPEAIQNAIKSGEARLVDVYALGIVAFELLAGALPYRGENWVQVLDRHLRDPVPSLVKAGVDVPLALGDLVAQMLAKEPEERPESIDVVIGWLRSIREGRKLRATDVPLSVLFVDDDPDFRELMRVCASELDTEVRLRLACNGLEALDRFRERVPDLLVVDLDMPEMNGVELCMYLRGMPKADATVIAVLSGHATQTDIAFLGELGVAEVIEKPKLGLEQLITSLEGLVARAAIARRGPRTRRDSPPPISELK